MSGFQRARGVSLAAILFELFPSVLLCALFVAVGIMHVTSRVLVVDVGYKLSKLDQESRGLTREHDRLKLELATLKSPGKLEQLAREKLKMVPPPAGTVFTVPPPGPLPTAVRPASGKPERGG
ncbi:MAG: cell division protein FtsL [Myxococcaceae bacterium]